MDTVKNSLSFLGSLLKRAGDRGATMVEYVLLVALVALIGAAGWAFVGNAISNTSDNVCQNVASANAESGGPTPVSCQ